ncbi:hypothetical protein LHEJCM1006_19370 [Lactobacillus helveticus]|nr:hypothetical protein LHEJCM1006_19370 [Lactobacillus helveticus]
MLLYHLCWPFVGGEASAPHVKNLDHPKSYSKVMLALAATAICFDLLGSMAIGMTVPKGEIQNSTGFVYTYGKLLTSIGLPGDLLQKNCWRNAILRYYWRTWQLDCRA